MFASALCTLTFHHSPDFANLISLSLRSLRLIKADLRTPPTTTISAILQTISCASTGFNFRPAASLKSAIENLNRSYFPGVDFNNFSEVSKKNIINEITNEFKTALIGIKKLPKSSKLGVYTAYIYYLRLLHKLKKTPSVKIKTTRIRVPNYQKFNLLLYSYFKHQFNLYKFIP